MTNFVIKFNKTKVWIPDTPQIPWQYLIQWLTNGRLTRVLTTRHCQYCDCKGPQSFRSHGAADRLQCGCFDILSLSSHGIIQISINRLLQKPIWELRANFGTISGTRLLQKEFILRAILAEDARDWSHFARPPVCLSVRFCLAPINTLLFEQILLSFPSVINFSRA